MSELDLDRILRVAAESSGYDEIVIDQLVDEVRRLRAEVTDLRLRLAVEDDDDEPFPTDWHGLTLTPWPPSDPTE